MPAYQAEVIVTTKQEVADPQGQAIEKALCRLPHFGHGAASVKGLRAGKIFHFELTAETEKEARAAIEELADKVLANHNTEQFTFTLKAHS